jgi:hypothetical protein
VEDPLAGAYDAEYDAFRGPTEARAGSAVSATVQTLNRSWRVWDSLAEERPVLLSYHWLDAKGGVVVQDGVRSPLPRPMGQGESCTVAFSIQCPEEPGHDTLAVDLVHEHVTWFSRAGVPPLHVPVRIV